MLDLYPTFKKKKKNTADLDLTLRQENRANMSVIGSARKLRDHLWFTSEEPTVLSGI